MPCALKVTLQLVQDPGVTFVGNCVSEASERLETGVVLVTCSGAVPVATVDLKTLAASGQFPDKQRVGEKNRVLSGVAPEPICTVQFQPIP